MWEWDQKKGCMPKNWCFRIVVLEKSLESPLGCKIKPVNPKRNQPWIFTGRTDAEPDAPILWPPNEKSQLTGKDPDSGKDWGWEEKGAAEDEITGWYHRLNGCEFEQTLEDSEGQGSLVCCKSQDWKVLDMTWQLNNNNWHIATEKVLGVQDNDLTYIHCYMIAIVN